MCEEVVGDLGVVKKYGGELPQVRQLVLRGSRGGLLRALGMAAGGYIHRREQEELLRGAAAVGLSVEDQANLAAGSDSVAVQQQAQDSSDDAVVAGAAGAAAFLAHSTRTVLRRGGAL